MTYGAFNISNIDKLGLYDTPTPKIFMAYLMGALHDATARKYTYRISQKSKDYVEMIASKLHQLGHKAWTYKEGKSRNVYVVEFAKRILRSVEILNHKEKAAYIRGYFDTEGSVPRNLDSRYYIYFAQKDLKDLIQVKEYLSDLSIESGRIHNPSRSVDPDYFRFYVLSRSFNDFAGLIGSWHPDKQKYLRMKI